MSQRVYVMTPARVAQFAAVRAQWVEQSRERMREIVSLMCAGLSDKLISRRIGLSVSAIKHKRSLFMARNQLKSHAQLGVWAERNGYTDVAHDENSSPRQSANPVVASNDATACGATA